MVEGLNAPGELAPFRRPLSPSPTAYSRGSRRSWRSRFSGARRAGSPAKGSHKLPVPVNGEQHSSPWQPVTASDNSESRSLVSGLSAPLILARPCDGFFPTSNLNTKGPASCFPLYQPRKPPAFLTNSPVVNDTPTSHHICLLRLALAILRTFTCLLAFDLISTSLFHLFYLLLRNLSQWRVSLATLSTRSPPQRSLLSCTRQLEAITRDRPRPV